MVIRQVGICTRVKQDRNAVSGTTIGKHGAPERSVAEEIATFQRRSMFQQNFRSFSVIVLRGEMQCSPALAISQIGNSALTQQALYRGNITIYCGVDEINTPFETYSHSY